MKPSPFAAAFYKGTRPGLAGLYNRAVRAWEKGEYSHCELVFRHGQSGSSSFEDGGVRLKAIDYDPARWDMIPLPDYLEARALDWFDRHRGAGYDLAGNLHLVVGFIPQSRPRKFCSEAVGEALGLPEAWRFGPNALYTALRFAFPITVGR